MKLPTAKHHCTLIVNGEPLVSYASRAGCIDTPGTIPWELVRDLFPGECVGHSSGHIDTKEVEPRAYKATADITFSAGRRISAYETSFSDPVWELSDRWEAFRDYK